MLIKQLIDRVLTGYNKGVASDDSRPSPRYVYNKLLTVRNRLLAQQRERNEKVSQWAYQTLPCIELITAPVHECPCLPPMGCTTYRSKHQLPHSLTDYNSHLIQSVTSVDGSISFGEVGWEEKKYKSKNKYTAAKPDYYIRNGYLYVTHRTGPVLISVTGLWEDPLEAYAFPSKCDDCQGDECIDCESPLDKEFPFDGKKIEILIEMTIQEIMGYFARNREDRTNNTADSPEQESK